MTTAFQNLGPDLQNITIIDFLKYHSLAKL